MEPGVKKKTLSKNESAKLLQLMNILDNRYNAIMGKLDAIQDQIEHLLETDNKWRSFGKELSTHVKEGKDGKSKVD